MALVVTEQLLSGWRGVDMLWLLALMPTPWAPVADKVFLRVKAYGRANAMMRAPLRLAGWQRRRRRRGDGAPPTAGWRVGRDDRGGRAAEHHPAQPPGAGWCPSRQAVVGRQRARLRLPNGWRVTTPDQDTMAHDDAVKP